MSNLFPYVRKPFFFGRLPLNNEKNIKGQVLEIIQQENYENIISLSSTNNRIIIIFSTNKLYSFGENNYGQLGTGDFLSTNTFKKIEISEKEQIIRSSCGGNFSLFYNEKLETFLCGTNKKINIPEKIDVKSLDIKSYDKTVCVMTSKNSIEFWNNFEDFENKKSYTFRCDIKEFSTGIGFSTILLENGSLYKVSGNNDLEFMVVPYNVLDGGNRFKSAQSCESYTAAIDRNGGVWFFGKMYKFDSNKAKITVADNIEKVFAFPRHAIMLDRFNKCYTFGANECGQLGNGTTDDSLTPTMIELDDTFYEATGGNEFTIFLPFGFTSEKIKYLKEDVIPGSLAKPLQDPNNYLEV